MSKIISEIKEVVIKRKVQLSEELTCEYEVINDKFTFNNLFKKGNKKFKRYTKRGVEMLQKRHWSLHHEVAIYEFQSEKELLNFDDFSSLYYVGCGFDGTVFDINLKPISCITHFDKNFCHSYFQIETTQEVCKKIINTFNTEYIIECNIVEIAYYNKSDSDDFENIYTLDLKCHFPQEIYEECMKGQEYETTQAKLLLFEKLKNK